MSLTIAEKVGASSVSASAKTTSAVVNVTRAQPPPPSCPAVRVSAHAAAKPAQAFPPAEFETLRAGRYV